MANIKNLKKDINYVLGDIIEAVYSWEYLNLDKDAKKSEKIIDEAIKVFDDLILEVKSNINIEIDEKIAEGTYSNLAIINHSVSEFVLDFICIMPGTPKNKVKSRIIFLMLALLAATLDIIIVLKSLEQNVIYFLSPSWALF